MDIAQPHVTGHREGEVRSVSVSKMFGLTKMVECKGEENAQFSKWAKPGIVRFCAEEYKQPVYYTHLTLPTKRIVERQVGDETSKKQKKCKKRKQTT